MPGTFINYPKSQECYQWTDDQNHRNGDLQSSAKRAQKSATTEKNWGLLVN